MKRLTFFMITILVIAVVALTITKAQVQKEVKPKGRDVMAPLPASLDNFFPPKAEQPVYLFRMLGMSKPLSGIVISRISQEFITSITGVISMGSKLWIR